MALSGKQAQAISEPEWKEIIRFAPVREGWGLTDETVDEVAGLIYGVKFKFVSGSPGYVGDLFILMSDALTNPPLVIGRVAEHLITIDSEH